MTINRNDDDAALDWAIGVADPAFDDWDGFTRWLEGDPARAGRYDAIVMALADAGRDLAAVPTEAPIGHQAGHRTGRRTGAPTGPTPAVVPGLRRRPRFTRRWLGGAMAAALIGSIGVGAWTQRARPYTIETADGRPRTMRLADGSLLALAGGTRVRLDRADPRTAVVEAGDALFRVRHDADDPFRVEAGGIRMTDLGTVFDVGRRGAVTGVAVAEGAVMVDPAGAAVRLDAGQAARIEGGRIVRAAIDAADVGGWREGRLAFDETPLADVAADLTRHTGIAVTVMPAIARQRFRGTLDIARLRRDPPLLGALLGVRVRTDDRGWTLEPPH